MNNEDLIKKLEGLKIPEIEIQSHKQKLRWVLLNSEHFSREKSAFFWIRRFAPVGIGLVLVLAIIGANLQTKPGEAQAMEIAKSSPQIQKALDDKIITLKDVKIKGNKAYILLSIPEEKLASLIGQGAIIQQSSVPVSTPLSSITTNDQGDPTALITLVAEINFDSKKVENLKSISVPIGPITADEKTEAINIAKSDPEVQKNNINFDTAQIIARPLPPGQLHFNDDKDEQALKIFSGQDSDRRIILKIKSNGNEYLITINLTQKKVEQISTEGNDDSENSDHEKDKESSGKENPSIGGPNNYNAASGKIGAAENKIEAIEHKLSLSPVSSLLAEEKLQEAKAALIQAKTNFTDNKFFDAFKKADEALKTASTAGSLINEGKSEKNDNDDDIFVTPSPSPTKIPDSDDNTTGHQDGIDIQNHDKDDDKNKKTQPKNNDRHENDEANSQER